jgi:hypothetical protein
MTTNAIDTGHGHMIARVSEPDDHGTVYWQCGSASGPMGTGWIDQGPLEPGQFLTLGFNYDTDEYGTFPCKIERVNRKTVSVQSVRTGQRHRVEI